MPNVVVRLPVLCDDVNVDVSTLLAYSVDCEWCNAWGD